jgi:hypothetical protein
VTAVVQMEAGAMAVSNSFARLRLLPIRSMNRATIKQSGSTAKPT